MGVLYLHDCFLLKFVIYKTFVSLCWEKFRCLNFDTGLLPYKISWDKSPWRYHRTWRCLPLLFCLWVSFGVFPETGPCRPATTPFYRHVVILCNGLYARQFTCGCISTRCVTSTLAFMREHGLLARLECSQTTVLLLPTHPISSARLYKANVEWIMFVCGLLLNQTQIHHLFWQKFVAFWTWMIHAE